jgi:hypothetical protein
MPGLVTILALGLVAVGVGYPLLTGTTSVTAWIPAMLGGAILAARFLGGGRTAQVATVVVAAVGLVACAIRLAKGGFDLAAPAQQAQALTAVLCVAILAVVLAPRA